jgi:predicted MFS family arabinose efflux permease
VDARTRPSQQRTLEWVMATACGLLVATIYYGQPVVGSIADALGIARPMAGVVVTLPLIGYGVGQLLLVPVADLTENRQLILMLLVAVAVGLLVLGLTQNRSVFLVFALLAGFAASVTQVLVPFVTYLVPEAERGKAVGRLVSGIMLGIMLARPASSLMAELWYPRAMYLVAALIFMPMFLMLRRVLPRRVPDERMHYGQLLLSMGSIYMRTGELRRRGFCHACMFGAFSAFWTSAPLWLTGPAHHVTQSGMAWIGLAGAAGALAPFVVGGLADRGWGDWCAMGAMALGAMAVLPGFFIYGGRTDVAGVVVTAVVLDFAVSAHLVFCQRAIYSLGAAQRSRMNGLFMATFFAGGSLASATSAYLYGRFGWIAVVDFGVTLPLLALVVFAAGHVRQPLSQPSREK